MGNFLSLRSINCYQRVIIRIERVGKTPSKTGLITLLYFHEMAKNVKGKSVWLSHISIL